jgi:hypothetical protein
MMKIVDSLRRWVPADGGHLLRARTLDGAPGRGDGRRVRRADPGSGPAAAGPAGC